MKTWEKEEKDYEGQLTAALKSLTRLAEKLKVAKNHKVAEELKAAVRFIIDDIRYLYKSAAYGFEKEYRMVYVVNDIKNQIVKTDITSEPLAFYLEIDKEDFLFSAGSAIMIGSSVPHKQQEADAVKEQLKILGKTGCKVDVSKIEYTPKT